MFSLALLFHFIGIIIGLGAVTVIDSMGFVARTSKTWTQTTIDAHHVTKPLIWIGIFLTTTSWLFLVDLSNDLARLKSILLVVLIMNGCFLSFYVSPRLDKLSGKKKLLPTTLQHKITGSVLISFISWWTVVVLTIYLL